MLQADAVEASLKPRGWAMSDDRPAKDWVEKRLGHEAYREPRAWGKIALWLVLGVFACGLVLYLAFGG
jgi:hypothetical protein